MNNSASNEHGHYLNAANSATCPTSTLSSGQLFHAPIGHFSTPAAPYISGSGCVFLKLIVKFKFLLDLI